MKAEKLLKQLLKHPPEALGRTLEALDEHPHPSQLEGLYVKLSRELGRGLLEAHLEEVDEPPATCRECESDHQASRQRAGLSPP